MSFAIGSSFRVKKGEDAHDLRREVIGGEPVVLAMVADGHGGSAASAFCRDFIFDAFLERANGDASAESLQAAGRAAFHRAHAEVHAIPGCTAGCTLTLCAVNEQRGELTCCNVGDTLAYLVSSELAGTAQMISADHRIDHSEEERARLKALGGNLGKAVGPDGQPGGPIRVYPGGLAVARGIGDADCADFVSCEPHVETRTLPDDFVLVVATDGLWDGTTLKQVTRIALKARTPEATAEKLLKLSVKLCGLFDDMTCIIVQRKVRKLSTSLSSQNSVNTESRLSPARKSRIAFDGADDSSLPRRLSSFDEQRSSSPPLSTLATKGHPGSVAVSSVVDVGARASSDISSSKSRLKKSCDAGSLVGAAERVQRRTQRESLSAQLWSWTRSLWLPSAKRRSGADPALYEEDTVKPGHYDDSSVTRVHYDDFNVITVKSKHEEAN
mmetsp:Transcript_11539/g.22382  ORF Transcript_11539/g.22382 Transcript_11539/m.22382 type:complete len:442 (+) Transcript_11539:107-1432(+)